MEINNLLLRELMCILNAKGEEEERIYWSEMLT